MSGSKSKSGEDIQRRVGPALQSAASSLGLTTPLLIFPRITRLFQRAEER